MDIKALKDIEDRLMGNLHLDAYERCLYYHLARHTRAEGSESALFSVLSLAKCLEMSETAIRNRIRSMHKKGCIKIEERSKDGHRIRVYLPDEIPGLPTSEPPTESIDLEAIDFYTDRRFVNVLIKREHSLCFWCLRQLGSAYALDHAIPIVKGGDNSYRNIVACCHECNALKQASEPEDFLRNLYRRGLLSQPELEERLLKLRRLQGGDLVPKF